MIVLIAQIIGAMVPAFFVSRLVMWFGNKYLKKPLSFATVHLTSALVMVVVGAYGWADGGPPQWTQSAMTYSTAQAAVALCESLYLSLKHRKSRSSQ